MGKFIKLNSNTNKCFTIILAFIAILTTSTNPASAGPDDSLTTDSGVTIDEQESNDINAQDISDYFDLENDLIDVLINASLSDKDDIDKYEYYAISGNNMSVQCNITEIAYNDFTSLASGPDTIYFITDYNTIWLTDGSNVSMLYSDSEIAEEIDSLELEDIIITDMCISDNNDIILIIDNALYLIDEELNISTLYTSDDIIAVTSESSAQPSSVACYDDIVYITDLTSMSILAGDLTASELTILADQDEISDAIVNSITNAELYDLLSERIDDGNFTFETETIASTTDTFRPTFMINVSDSDTYDDGFYISQFSDALDGTGEITLLSQDSETEEYEFSTFMAADNTIVHPTALAISTLSEFDNAMYMGNFGDTLGNEFDGMVYKIASDGTATDFVTSFVDSEGNQVTKGTTSPTDVTGFYDIIDMKFPPDTTEFDSYLYVLSENIDDNTDLGNDSDLWRIGSDGVAELFVENIMPAAGRMVFDTVGNFDNQLIVAPWGYTYGGKIVTVDSEGVVTDLYTLSSNVLDIAIAPEDSFFQGALLITLADGDLIGLDYDPDDTDSIRVTTWATDLPTGSIPGGNIIFDDSNDMYILCGEDKSVIKFNYNNLQAVTNITDTQVQELEITDDNTITHIPYILVEDGINPKILSITTTDQGTDEEATTVAVFEDGDSLDDEDTIDTIGFTFSEDGHCYLYSNMGGFVKIAEWDIDDFDFGSFVALTDIAHDEIEDTIGLSYTEIKGITITPTTDNSSYSYIYAIASNGLNNLPDTVTETPSQTIDDTIVYLGNPTSESYLVSQAFPVTRLNSMSITVSGPDNSTEVYETDTVSPVEVYELDLTGLNNGNYTVEVSSYIEFAGEYELMITNKGVFTEILIDQDTPETSFNLVGGEEVVVRIAGKGQALISANTNPETENVIDIYEVEISGTTGGTVFDILNNDDPDNLSISNITINNSLKSLTCHGTVESITTDVTRSKAINNLKLRSVQEIDLPTFGITTMTVETIGTIDPNDTNGVSSTKNTIDTRYLKNLYVNKDVFNTTFFEGSYTNTFANIEIDGRIIGSDIYSKLIKTMHIRNKDEYTNAAYDLNVYARSDIKFFTISQGSLNNSTVQSTLKSIKFFELSNGDLIDSNIYAKKLLYSIILNSETDQENGNITGSSTITAYSGLKNMYAAGYITKDSAINVYATVYNLITGGNFSGSLYAYNLIKFYVGYDQQGKRLSEDNDYTGADYTGDTTVIYTIKNFRVTGQMRGDNTGDSTLNSSYGSIYNVYIEDGATGYISASSMIKSIMVGMLNGNRRYIVNEEADVNLKVSTKRLIRLYYTGELDNDSSLSGNPIIVDLVD